jgi:putative DNA primase/helicase
LGIKNISKVDLIELDDHFLFAQIENKIANLVSEVDTKNNINIKRFKEYVGGEKTILINKKFQEPYEIPPTAKLLYAVNDDFPKIPDNADKGFFRKWIIIECPNEFDENDDPYILEKLLTENELSGFLNMALDGLALLLKEKKFDYNSKAIIDWDDVKEFWLHKINIFSQFLEEKCEIGNYLSAIEDPNNLYWHKKDDLLKDFNEWIIKKGKKSRSKTQLTKMVKQAGYNDDRRQVNGKSINIYTGFRIKGSDLNDQLPKKRNIEDWSEPKT